MSNLHEPIKIFRLELQKLREKYLSRQSMASYHQYHIEAKKLAEFYLEKWPEFNNYPKAKGYPYLTLKESEEYLNSSSYQHGGARPGAGRKKEEKTQQIRVPVSMASYISQLKDLYKKLDDECKSEIIEQLKDLISYIE